jgi:hypothetical protein
MSTGRHSEDIVARYVAIMGFYHKDGKTTRTKAAMVAEVRAITARVNLTRLNRRVIYEQILQPVRTKLIARYSFGAGTVLNSEFMDVFKCAIVG